MPSAASDSAKGVLYLVATPIGNLEDMTWRAVRVLGEVDVIAAEDTRRSGQLLRHFEIEPKRLVSFFEGNEAERSEELCRELVGGARVALVTDAGMPGISDPGQRLVARAIERQTVCFVDAECAARREPRGCKRQRAEEVV